MSSHTKYKRGYFMPPKPSLEWSKKEYIESAPLWCSVDLRDGNQALITPMSLEEKITFFKLLLQVGFKDIEVGFPAASETEYRFLRTLIEENLIPSDVRVQVLTQAREHIIKKTFESLEGCQNAVVHFYNSTSYAQREQVFKKSKEDIKKIFQEKANANSSNQHRDSRGIPQRHISDFINQNTQNSAQQNSKNSRNKKG